MSPARQNAEAAFRPHREVPGNDTMPPAVRRQLDLDQQLRKEIELNARRARRASQPVR